MTHTRIAFFVAWAVLCLVVAVSAWQTDQLVAENRAAIEETQRLTCGVWLSNYIVANEGLGPMLPPKQAAALLDRLSTDFTAKCDSYVQEGTQ